MKAYDDIRAALRGAGALTEEQIVVRSGVAAERVAAFLKRDDVKPGDAPGTYTLGAVVAAAPAPVPPKKRAKRKAKKQRRAAGERKQLREIARKARAPRPATAHELAFDSYRGLGAGIRNFLRTQVTGIEGDPVLTMLLDQHERAEKLLDATAGRT